MATYGVRLLTTAPNRKSPEKAKINAPPCAQWCVYLESNIFNAVARGRPVSRTSAGPTVLLLSTNSRRWAQGRLSREMSAKCGNYQADEEIGEGLEGKNSLREEFERISARQIRSMDKKGSICPTSCLRVDFVRSVVRPKIC